jgi:hypothetical protein
LQAVRSIAYIALANHREVSQIGPGQVETYSEFSLQGTAANVIMPL